MEELRERSRDERDKRLSYRDGDEDCRFHGDEDRLEMEELSQRRMETREREKQ